MRDSHTGSRILTLGFVLTCVISACSDDNKSDGGDEQGEGDCNLGELDCACNEGLCLGDLECVNDMCVSPCIPGELGCECNDGQCLSGLECSDNVCVDPNCTPGELLCECNDGLCLGDLECVGNVCTESSSDTTTGDGDTTTTTTGDGDTTTTTGDTTTTTGDTTTTDTTGDGDTTTGGDCPNANEMMCDGQCIDVMADDDNCGGCGVECIVHLWDPPIGRCVEGSCTPTWSECLATAEGDGMTCDEICALSGQTCAENQCGDGYTALWSNSSDDCATGISSNYKTFGCDVVFGWQGEYYGCCCTQ